GTPLQFVFGNQLESLQSDSAEPLVVFPENADFIDRCSNWSARHKRSLAQAEAWRNWLNGCEAGETIEKRPKLATYVANLGHHRSVCASILGVIVFSLGGRGRSFLSAGRYPRTQGRLEKCPVKRRPGEA